MLRIALAQINPIVGDISGNAKKIAEYIDRAKQENSDIIVFPELIICGYPPEDLLYKKHFIGENIKALNGLSKFTKDIIAIIGFVDRDKKGELYNAAAILTQGKIKGIYHKHELPNYGVFDEKRYFSCGTTTRNFFVKGVNFAVNICEDIWVDHGVYKSQAKSGAKLIVNISSSPYDINKLKARELLLTKRAKETKAFICYANLVGGQDELVFDGASMVINPEGKIIARAKQFEEDLLIADINLGRNKTTERSVERPYNTLEQIDKALILGTKDYVQKNGFKKVLIGMSGGIDSALVAAIAVDAIGKEAVIGVSMPSRFSSQGTRQDAKQICENLGIEYMEIPIEEIFKSYLTVLKGPFSGTNPNVAEENIQARIRGNLLMALSNKFGWLVLTTGNKSEIGVGYCTLYGDMSGGFAVIKDVPKTRVYELAALRNKRARKDVIPQTIIDRAPTAELRENQKDQDSLPKYAVLDKLLEKYVEKHQSLGEMAKAANKDIAKQLINLIDKSEYKRRQAPPGIKITSRAFGKDWRVPITNKFKEF